MFEIVSGERLLVQAEFEAQVSSVAAALLEIGIREDDPVLLLMRNDIEFAVASQAIAAIGAYVLAVNWHGTPDDVRYIAEDADAEAVIVHADLLGLVAGLDVAIPIIVVEPGDYIKQAYGAGQTPALPHTIISWDALVGHAPHAGTPRLAREPIIYTSGTTGKPKGVRRFPSAGAEQAQAMRGHLARTFGLVDGAHVLVSSPLYHSAPASYLRVALATLKSSGLVVIQPKFDAEKVLETIEACKITCAWMVPTMFVALLRLPEAVRKRYDVSSLRWITTSAAPFAPDVKRQIADWFGPVVYEFYGSTEVGPVTLATPKDAVDRSGTVGRAMAGAVVSILGEDGEVLPAGAIGEIACRHVSFPDFTYSKREGERRALDRGNLIATGDIGYLDTDGYLFLCDRKSHMIISGGVNIFPAEIESAALAHPAIKDCAAFGIPDDVFGETVALAVQRVEDADLAEDELRLFLKSTIASYKVPKKILFYESLPRDDSGKIYKRILRAPFWEKLGRTI